MSTDERGGFLAEGQRKVVGNLGGLPVAQDGTWYSTTGFTFQFR